MSGEDIVVRLENYIKLLEGKGGLAKFVSFYYWAL